MNNADVKVYDTTLRDGCQAEQVSFSVEDKLRVARRLIDLGVAYVEGGWPHETNSADLEFFQQARDLDWGQTKLAAFGSTRRKDTNAAEDSILRYLVESQAPVVAIVGKSWELHVTDVLGTSRDENLAMIEDSVAFVKNQGREVIFDAEHFFDGYTSDPEYALAAIGAAEEGGADAVVLCDTNGGTLTSRLGPIVSHVCDDLGCAVGIHTHNDAELAVANSLTAVESGASIVQGTINGVGERCGNANLVSIIAGLQLKMGVSCLPNGGVDRLTYLSRSLDEIANRVPWRGQPYVGSSAFAHKGGVHVSAVTKDSRTYEHITPAAVGNQRHILVSDLSGRAAIVAKMRERGVEMEPGDPHVQEVLDRIKALENEGYQYEGAEGSFQLLVDEVMARRKSYFALEELDVTVSMEGEGDFGTESSRSVARMRIRVGDVIESSRAAGNGPVHAMDRALCRVLDRIYPALEDVRLVDYKVRIVSGTSGTDSIVRVLILSCDRTSEWGTVGASTNIIEASWQALSDALEYKLARENVEPPPLARTLG